jgi:cell division topological specificity factor
MEEGADMGSFFNRILGRENKSADQAKERLKLVLIHDRTDLSPGALDMMKDELIAVISRYVQIDSSAVRIGVEQNGREQRLVADIPLKPAGRRKRG